MEEVEGSFPSNYVTIHQLKQRWLQQQTTIDDSVSKTPNNNPLTPTNNHPNVVDNQGHITGFKSSRPPKPRIIRPQPEPEPEPVEVEDKKQQKGGHPSRNQKVLQEPEPEPEPEPSVEDKKQYKGGRRSRNRKQKQKTAPQNDDAGAGVEDVVVAAPVKEQLHQGGRGNSRNKKLLQEPSLDAAVDDHDVEHVVVVSAAPVKEQHQAGHERKNKKLFRSKTPTFDVAADDDGGGVVDPVVVSAASSVKEKHYVGRGSRIKKGFRPKTPPFDAAAAAADKDDGVVDVKAVDVAPVKEQHQAVSRNKKVFRPKTPPFVAAVAADTTTAGDNDDAVVIADSASVKEINVCNVSHTRGRGYRRFQGGPEQRRGSRSNGYPKQPFWRKKEQMSQVWVKKRESAPN